MDKYKYKYTNTNTIKGEQILRVCTIFSGAPNEWTLFWWSQWFIWIASATQDAMKHQERCLGLKSALYGHGSCSFPCIYAFIEYFVKCTYIACVTYISKRTAPVAAEILIHSLPGFLSRHLAPRKRYAALYVICYTFNVIPTLECTCNMLAYIQLLDV